MEIPNKQRNWLPAYHKEAICINYEWPTNLYIDAILKGEDHLLSDPATPDDIETMLPAILDSLLQKRAKNRKDRQALILTKEHYQKKNCISEIAANWGISPLETQRRIGSGLKLIRDAFSIIRE